MVQSFSYFLSFYGCKYLALTMCHYCIGNGPFNSRGFQDPASQQPVMYGRDQPKRNTFIVPRQGMEKGSFSKSIPIFSEFLRFGCLLVK